MIDKNMKYHQHKSLLRAKYNVSTSTLKMLSIVLNQFKFTENNSVKVEKKTIFKYIPTFTHREEIQKSFAELGNIPISKLADKNIICVHWMSGIQEYENHFEFEIPNMLVPFLKPFLEDEFQNINLLATITLKSDTSIRLHQLFSQYVNCKAKCVQIKILELKEMFGNENMRNNNFISKIKKCCDEITANTDIEIKRIDKIQKNGFTESLYFTLEKKITASIDDVHIVEQQENNISSDKKEEIKIKVMTESEPVQIIKKTPQKQSENIEEYKVWFEKIWSLYPNKKGKTTVQRKAKTLYSEKEKVEIALNNYLRDKDLKINGGFKSLKDASTFFNQYKDFLVIEKNENISSDKKTKNWGY